MNDPWVVQIGNARSELTKPLLRLVSVEAIGTMVEHISQLSPATYSITIQPCPDHRSGCRTAQPGLDGGG